MTEDNRHTDNLYAYNEDFKEIYIGDVPVHENGTKKNYFCLGCKRQMQAIKGQIRKQHFKHHVKPYSTEKKCTYRDETYRHKLAKDIIQLIKKIKVPSVYKYDPENKTSDALLIREAQFIQSHKVLIERHIYEDLNGDIEIANKKNEKKTLLIRPDAILVDKTEKPILIIEFVATHKPDTNKLIKLKRLGIDAIQVSIPKSSPEDIEKCFSTTKHTKWLFNNEESNTDYLQFSNEYSGAIFEVDEEQRKLFEEGYKCRSAEIRELIRTIERLLETEQFKGAQQHLRSEIQRVEKNTIRANERLDNIREEYIREGIEEHRDRREQLSYSEEEFSKYASNMEERYLRKRRELETSRRKIEQSSAEIEFSILENDSIGPTTSRMVEEQKGIVEGIRREKDDLDEKEAKREAGERESFKKDKENIESEIRRMEAELESIPNTFKREGRKLQSEFDETSKTNQNEIKRISREGDRLSAAIREESEKFGERKKSNDQYVIQEFKKGKDSIDGRIAEEHRKVYNFIESFREYKQTLSFLERVEKFIREQT